MPKIKLFSNLNLLIFSLAFFKNAPVYSENLSQSGARLHRAPTYFVKPNKAF